MTDNNDHINLTIAQRDTLFFIQTFRDKHSVSPTYTEIAEGIIDGVQITKKRTKSAVANMMILLEQKGVVARARGGTRNTTLLKRI
jgi:SOS-response transcriptional repressor LexA